MEKKGPEGFHNFYYQAFGPRWENLKGALLQDTSPVGFQDSLIRPYFLDEASVLCARCLDVREDHKVLDLCAAPGGKTLVIASALGPSGSLTSNEKSPDRRRRLQNVVADHLGEKASQVRITGFDGTLWGLHEKSVYDRILLDSPCSSERHVLHSPAHLAQWSPARTKHLAIQSFSLLASALEALKPGGILVYSTCALSPLENDEVIEKLHKKRKGQFEILDPALPYGEKTKYGVLILPDSCNGKGPLYVCKLSKIPLSPGSV